ncbi:hypothetical protein BN1723_006893 [Verticillium longisporum]|uniref:FAD-binding PCMH-type domain-containing protein n=1 Tax=Verticillium longisporum TaxID=100787 RepID=A0A0G4NI50_VERLO|nr:hypothetical protein BN1723_006893 [Verticillium longisporum]
MVATRMILCLSLSAIGASAQALESPDFNVTQQLLDLGVNVGALPELSNFVERRSATLPCAAACLSLSITFGRDSVLSRGEAPYESFTGAYWSENQGEVDPYCIFKPANPSAISVLVLLSRLTQCPFAVKSGGHAAFAGASSIEGGITVSLEKINQVTLSSDKKTVVIGAGNRWSDVYRKLSKSDVTVTGGRVSSVGVGGLSLGGGISFFSNLHGWACDNVESYEVVTATGIILTASPKQNPNLYWALRGGGNNFGIVTNFTFRTIPLPGGQLWGGTKTFMEPALDAVVDAFAGMVTDSPQDPNAGLWVAWLKNSGLKLAATELWYAKPDGGSAAIFDAFNAIAPIADSTGNKFLPDYTDGHEASNPSGLREIYYGLTVKADARLARLARDIFYEEYPASEAVAGANPFLPDYTDGHEASNPSGLREIYYGLTVKADARLARLARDIFYDEYPAAEAVAGANPVMIFQAITTGQMARMRANGGNPLGLDAADGPLYLIHVACWWQDAAGDAAIHAMISTVLARITAEAKALGLQNDYVYMNYASAFQDVIKGYGAANAARLKSIAKTYDLTGVFQRLQPGHFKLNRAPVTGTGYFSGLNA